MTQTNAPTAPTVSVNPAMPWAAWSAPDIFESEIHEIRARRGEGGLELVRGDDEEVIGRANQHCLRELSTRVGFPVDFVQKLEPNLQAQVINDRIQAAREQEFAFAVESGAVSNILPAWRGVNAHSHVAQVAYDTLSEQIGGINVAHAHVTPAGMALRLLTPREQPVTPKVGDVLRMGVEVRHSYGMDLSVSLFAERLICTNGMTTTDRGFGWSHKSLGGPQDQLAWLRRGVGEAIESYGDLVARAQQMADARYTGDYAAAIRERARALHIPQRHWAAIIEAFEQEPGDTEWALLNAFTRWGTHSAQADLGRRLQSAAGDWTMNFDMVTARLPRPMAERVGARIIDQIEEPVTA